MPANNDQPVKFAKSMICELANIRATLKCLSEILLDDVANRTGADKATLRSHFKARANAKAKEYYAHYVHELGFEDTQGGRG